MRDRRAEDRVAWGVLIRETDNQGDNVLHEYHNFNPFQGGLETESR